MKKILLVSLLALAPYVAFAATPSKAASAGSTMVKLDESKVKWIGRKLGGEHSGFLKLKSGQLVLDKNTLKGGEFEIDMTSLTNEDITDASSNGKLVGHLKSDDFFSVEKNPTAKFKITKVEKAVAGKQNITGDLTIKGITHPITFPAEVTMKDGKVTAVGKLEVDRTKYDIKYRSLKFFSDIGDKVIKDIFTVDVNLVAGK